MTKFRILRSTRVLSYVSSEEAWTMRYMSGVLRHCWWHTTLQCNEFMYTETWPTTFIGPQTLAFLQFKYQILGLVLFLGNALVKSIKNNIFTKQVVRPST
jgi:hypothetical protein